MKHRVIALSIAGAIAGFLSLGAISFASAQTTSTTTPSTTTAPSGDTHDDANCPNMGGSSSSPSSAPSAENTSYFQ